MRLHNRFLTCGIACLILSCRTGAPPPPVAGIDPDPQMREMGRLSFLAYVGDALQGSDPEVEKTLTGCMTAALEEQAPDWELAWGPAVYHFASTELDDNMMYVARNKTNRSTLAIVVRGTNPAALLDWLVEDFDVVDQVSWPGSPSGQARISKGTSEGLHILQDMKGVVHEPDLHERKTLAHFLHEQVRSRRGLQVLYVTGHSLGGALSPTLALWLKETQNAWDPAGQVQILVVPLAGPTAGNADFAAYYDQQLGSSSPNPNATQRLWNSFDLVPLAWNHESMGKMEDLYEPLTRANPLERGPIDGLRSLVKDKGYAQINPAAPSLSGFVPSHNLQPSHQCKSERMDWLAEVLWQHHWGYQCALGIMINSSTSGCPSKTPPPCPDVCQKK